ncbi:MAG: hypothetical protein B6U76_12265 [Desulfurococcales archaeon ex4484_217_2]|nr:MAG: hypothetical protein B6U76_12265 [Desulfurococcales archaeon ex4484_217_2]
MLTWAWIGRRRQREIIALCLTHINKIIEESQHLKKLLENCFKRNREEAKKEFEKIFNLEREADDIKRNIFMELSKGSKIPEEILKILYEMASKVYESTLLIRDAIMEIYENPKEALEIADKIEALEEEVDEIRVTGLAKILEWCNKTEPSACIIAKETIDSIENAEDRCEDVADVIRSIALLSL